MTIGFVCSQNRLRSILASEALRAKRPDLKIETGGIPKKGRKFGRKADKRAREIIQSHYGIDLSGYRSQAVTGEMIERAARIFVLSDHNRKELVKYFPAAQGKIELFCSRSLSDWNVNALEMFEEHILPAAERWARLLVCKKKAACTIT